MNKTLVLVTSALLALPLASYAIGPVEGDKSFTVSASGNSDQDFDVNTYGVNGELGYFLTDKWQAGVRQSVNGASGSEVSDNWVGSTRGFVDYNFLDGSYRPYIGANLGGIYGGDNVDSTGQAGLEAGLKLYVLEKTYINFGVEYSFLFDDTKDFDNKSNDGIYSYTIGVGFNW
jgi:hypothetical protein